MSKNDITGDTLISKPSNDNYRNEHDRIFGKQLKEITRPTVKALNKITVELDKTKVVRK